MWKRPCQKMGTSGSFIQLAAGSKWNCGRRGSAARDSAEGLAMDFGAIEMAAPATAMVFKKFRRTDRRVEGAERESCASGSSLLFMRGSFTSRRVRQRVALPSRCCRGDESNALQGLSVG